MQLNTYINLIDPPGTADDATRLAAALATVTQIYDRNVNEKQVLSLLGLTVGGSVLVKLNAMTEPLVVIVRDQLNMTDGLNFGDQATRDMIDQLTNDADSTMFTTAEGTAMKGLAERHVPDWQNQWKTNPDGSVIPDPIQVKRVTLGQLNLEHMQVGRAM